MTQQIIDVGAAANDGTGEPLRQAFTAVNDNFTEIWTAGPVGSQVKISGNVITTTVTNLGLTLAGNGIGNIQANSTIVPGTAGVYDIGAPDRTFQYIYGDYLVGNGALITGIVANTTYNNSNVAAFLPTYTGNLVSLTGPVRTTANVTAGNFITGGFLSATGNITGGNITGNNLISSGYISAVGNITTAGNISGNYLLGNGAFITGITATNIAAAALTGTTLSSNVLYSSLKVVDDLLYLDVIGNITTQGRFIGSGAGLTNIPAANITGQVANALTAGTVYTNAQPNITSVGTLTSLTATGNIAGNYFIGNGALLTGISTSGVNANALVGDVLSSNVLYSSLQIVGNLVYVNVDGNVTTTGRFIGSGAGLTNIPGANVAGAVANATYAVTAGTAYSVAGANVTGTVANAIYATTSGSATNANTANTATYANTANAVAGANVSGTVANATYATNAGSATTATTATTAGTVTTAAQPNITSVGTLTSIAVSGNATAGNVLTGGKISAVGNITGNYFIGNGSQLTGVSASNVNANALVGDVLSSNVLYSSLKVVDDLLYLDVVGNITTTDRFIGSGAGLTNIPGGNITGTVANATYATTAGSATTATYANTANIVAGANVTGTVANATYATTAGSATTAGTVTTAAQPNITSVGTLTSVAVTGNATGGNLLTTGQVSATGNITGNYFVGNGRQLTGILATEVGVLANLSVIGNTQTGNLLTGGLISAVGNIKTTGNVSGNYFIGNGSQLTGITVSAGTAIVNGNSNVTVNANGNITISSAGFSNVAVFANTGVYVDGLVSSTGNIAGNYLLGNGAFITGLPAGYSNADVANYLPTYSGNLVSLTGPVTTTSNITGGNVLTGGSISAVGNVSGNYILGNGALLTGVITSVANINNGTSNVTVVSSGGNVTVGVAGTSNVAVFAATGEYVTGVISASGNVTGGNVLTAGLISATSTITSAANIIGSNILTGGLISATGNIQGNVFIGNGAGLTNLSGANVTGTVANATYADLAGTVTNNAQANITSVGILTSLSVSGNTTTGNLLTGGLISATSTITSAANITGGNILTAGLISATSTITSAANITGGNVLTGGLISATGNVTGGNVNTNNIFGTALTITSTGALNLAPTGNITANSKNITGLADPVADQDAATKAYVDSIAQGLDPKASVSLATATALPAYTYDNGTAGVGATITGSSSGLLTIDGTAPTVGDRVLIKNETGGNAPYNGIYVVTTNDVGSPYVLTRATDMNQSSEVPGAFTFVELGTVNADSGYVCTTNAPVVIGTTNIVWTQFSSAGSYTANTSAGLNLIGSQFNAKIDDNTTAFDGSGNIIVKAGANLTTPNIGAATGTSLSATGNVNGGNVNTSGLVSATGNITGGNILTAGAVSATGNVLGNFFIGNGSQLTGVIASGGQGNTITLGTPTDGNLTGNTVAYTGWTTSTFVTDGLDDLNQVAFNLGANTFVGNAYITANTNANINGQYAGPSPLTIIFTGHSIGNPNSYLWQWGDGTSNVTTANATHTFSNVQGGTFTTSYTVYNSNGTYGGNATAGAKGSVSTATATILLYTPQPIPAITLSNNSFDTGTTITITNASTYTVWYDLSFGDGTANFIAGPGYANTTFTTVNHQYNASAANTDSFYQAILTGTSNTAGASNVSVTSAASNVKVYASQASNVLVTANRANVINNSGTISFRNDSNGHPGNTSTFGAQQYYYFNYGDGNVSNVVIATGTAGNPGAANVTNLFALSAANQAGNIYQQFTANLYLYTGFSTSPFKSSNITITVEPQTVANFVGTTANVTTNATANTGNARVGYLFTDYNSSNRSTFTFQNTSQNSNLANWTWGDSTFSNGVSNVGNTLHTYNSTGAFTVSLQANGTPNGITSTAQSNTLSQTGYIFIAANPTAPTNLSGFANLAIANASQFTNAPLLAAGATDATGGNIPANGTSVTRFATTTTIATAGNVINANTGISSAQVSANLFAYVNNANAGNVSFSNVSNTVGTSGALVVSADQDLHVANAAVPSYFYKVFSANISCALSSLSTGYNNYKLVNSVTGNTNYVGFVKDNLNSAPTLTTSGATVTSNVTGTYNYISGIPYYGGGGAPAVALANVQVSNLAGQTYTSTNPFVVASGTNQEGSGSVISAQTYTLTQIDGSPTMLTGSNVKANTGVASAYTLGTTVVLINGAVNAVANLKANILNVIGTSSDSQIPTYIQVNGTANTGVQEANISIAPTGTYTDAGIRVTGFGTASNTPTFSSSTNFYTANAWAGNITVAGTQEAVIRYGNLKHYTTNLSSNYLPVGPDLNTGRSGTQYFTFAFRRTLLQNFSIAITGNVAGVWATIPGTKLTTTVSGSGPTSTLNGWLTCSTFYAGSGTPGANTAAGGNGSNGIATNAQNQIPVNQVIASSYNQTFGDVSTSTSGNQGNNMLIRIALDPGQYVTAVSIGT
jgi:hypothetical protein